MARIFSIQFTYEGVAHHVMVAARTTPFFNEYVVTMLDETIAHLLPNNKIISTPESFVFSDSTSENSPALMQAILRAVSGYLQVIDA